MRCKRRAQGALEFMILIAALLFFFVVIFVIIQENISKKNVEKEKMLLQNVALGVRDEINLAAESSEGYFREFATPSSIFGREYEIEITNSLIYASMNGIGFSYRIYTVNGEIEKGENNISKENGQVYLNK